MDEDPAVTAELVRKLDPSGYRVMSHADVEQAARTLSEGPRIDVLLVDCDLDRAGPRPLTLLASASAYDVASIVMLKNATAKAAAAALDNGAAAVLDKPFTIEELNEAITRATRAGFRGNLDGISLVDMLQVFHISRRSLVVSLGGNPSTRIVFEAGEIVHAERGQLTGEAVLHDTLEAKNGSIRTLPPEPGGPVTIERSFQSLMLDVLRQRDENRSGSFPAVDDGLEDDDLDVEHLLDDEIPDEGGLDADAEWEIEGEAEPEPEAEAEPEASPPPPQRDPPVPPPIAAPAPREAATALPTRPWDPICAAVNAEVPSAIATALVDLQVGNLIGLHNRASFTADFERFVALYTYSLFRGPETRHIERTMSAQQGIGEQTAPYLEEIVLTSRHTHHLTKVLKAGRVAIMVVVPRRASVNESWSVLRGLVKGLESNLP